MLEQKYQENAFFALRAAGGLKSPESVQIYTQAIQLVESLIEQLVALTPETIIYPASLRGELEKIDGVTELLTDVVPIIRAIIKLLCEQSSLSSLIRLSMGWDLYCRLYSVAEEAPAIVESIADCETPAGLVAFIKATSLEDITQAFSVVNSYLLASTAIVPPAALPADVIAALTAAVDAFSEDTLPLAELIATIQTDYNDATESLSQASSTFDDAVVVTLLDSLTTTSTSNVSDAVNSITPPSVLAIFSEK